MNDLKTLNGIEEENIRGYEYISKGELRQETIKWIKEYENRKTGHTKSTDFIGNAFVIYFIKHFFNIL